MKRPESRSTVEEQRPAVRVAVDFEAQYGPTGTSSRSDGRVTEISTSGLRLRTTRAVIAGSALDITFGLGARARGANATVRVRARVVRVVAEAPPHFEYALIVVDEDCARNALRQAVLSIELAVSAEVRRY